MFNSKTVDSSWKRTRVKPNDPQKIDEQKKYTSKAFYTNVIGNLMYAMLCVIPHISFAIGIG